MDNIIEVENLSKLYKLGVINTGTLSHDLNRLWYRVRKKEDPYLKTTEKNIRNVRAGSDYIWSLKDINFQVQQGDVYGIIGNNGAGKSTLLKIISKVTKPTSGEIRIAGNIASLLEVGTGFHPELSGRENIFLNGAILGMRKQEIKRKFDEIVQFSGVERFIDTPVKRYSSGMYVRLAFAVSAHLEPEILIVDEVLSVGDIEFQEKCLGKMKDISQRQGRTVLFVSHNIAAIKQLCNKATLLEYGLQKKTGYINEVLTVYQEDKIDKHKGERGYVPHDLPAYFVNWELAGNDFDNKHTCFSGDDIELQFGLLANETMRNCEVRFMIKYDDLLIMHSGSMTNNQHGGFTLMPGLHKIKFRFNFPVRDAKFNIEAGFMSQNKVIDNWVSSTQLTVLDDYKSNLFTGVINPGIQCTVEEMNVEVINK